MFIIGSVLSGVVIFLVGLLLADNSQDIMIFVSLINIFFLAAISCGVTLATGNFKTYIKGINALLSQKYHISAADKEKAIRYFKMMGRIITQAGIMLTVMSILFMLLTLDDPSTIGPKAAVALVSIFYSMLVNLIFISPAVHVLESRYNQEEKRVISEKQVMDKLLELCYKQGISPEEIMDAKQINFTKE